MALRPWVLIYDPNVPKDEAIMLDLALEPARTFARPSAPNCYSRWCMLTSAP